MGNPGLQPYESTNLDASVAYYLPGNSGMIMLGLFYKDIKNPIYDYGYNAATDTNVELTVPGMERTTVNGADVVTYRGYTFESISVATKQNADAGKISGLEVTYQQDFAFLPAPFDGFGAIINVTWIDSEVTLFDRPGVNTPFFRQPDMIANAQLYYQHRGFEARLAWHFQDDSLGLVGSDPLLDQYTRSREQFDAKISYRVNENWGIFLEGKNLNNAPYRTYMGYSRDSLGGSGNAFPGYEESGITYYMGLNYSFGN
jgi:TonB-dependent receptor